MELKVWHLPAQDMTFLSSRVGAIAEREGRDLRKGKQAKDLLNIWDETVIYEKNRGWWSERGSKVTVCHQLLLRENKCNVKIHLTIVPL